MSTILAFNELSGRAEVEILICIFAGHWHSNDNGNCDYRSCDQGKTYKY